MSQVLGNPKFVSPITSSSKLQQAREERLRKRLDVNKSFLEEFDGVDAEEIAKPIRRVLSFNSSSQSQQEQLDKNGLTPQQPDLQKKDETLYNVQWKQYV